MRMTALSIRVQKLSSVITKLQGIAKKMFRWYENTSGIRQSVCVSGGKKCLFFGNFGVLCFLKTLVLRFPLLPYYRQTVI